ncbi:hypothetical protein [Thiorhodovibrio winogradskyi]|uniref:hypothetical protein n=1 Tax=Thiorhodovibrio winogradskyi TaxID=77007 RepID=UPI001F5CD9AD|nr:hypothetical protein [Thiorhodovibrio winogradskyi]
MKKVWRCANASTAASVPWAQAGGCARRKLSAMRSPAFWKKAFGEQKKVSG